MEEGGRGYRHIEGKEGRKMPGFMFDVEMKNVRADGIVSRESEPDCYLKVCVRLCRGKSLWFFVSPKILVDF